MRLTLYAAILAFLPIPALADGFEVISDKSAFLKLVKDKDLRIGLYNLTLNVAPNGQITGSALGWGITGQWSWNDGYFCREMDWSGYAIEANCQQVQARASQTVRFVSDRGQGQSASFRLR